MFGSLGFPELIFIFLLALVIFGPRKLPEIGRTVGKGLAEFRKASTDLKRSLNAEMIEEEMRQSDPRKILRDELGPGLSEPNPRGGPRRETPVASSSAEPSGQQGAPGTVSRGSGTEAENGESVAPSDPPAETSAESRAL